MPRDDTAPICGTSKISCYDQAEDDLIQEQYVNGITDDRNSHSECNCLPACTSIRYEAEISQAPFDWQKLYSSFNVTPTSEHPG